MRSDSPASGARSIWLRHNLQTDQLHLKVLEAKVTQEGCILTGSRLIALEKTKEEKTAHVEIEAHH